jgi:hypothetical protein
MLHIQPQSQPKPDRKNQQAKPFHKQPKFYKGRVGAYPNRLNSRHQRLIAENQSLIEGKRILDIASHDGRWSWAALEAGASEVFGIEARSNLVKRSCRLVPGAKFVCGDALEQLKNIPPRRYDTVFCFGCLYHFHYHFEFLQAVARLEPSDMIIDTDVTLSKSKLAYIKFKEEQAATGREGNAYVAGRKTGIVGVPTKAAIELFLSYLGFSWRYIDWSKQRDWGYLQKYKTGERVSLVCHNQSL